MFVRRKRGKVLLVHNQRIPGTSRVQQREICGFSSPAELAGVLSPAGWRKWKEAIAWRWGGLEFDWKAIRESLAAALKAWNADPAGARPGRDRTIGRLLANIRADLAQLTRVRAADASAIEAQIPVLEEIHESIKRILSPDGPSQLNPRNQEKTMPTIKTAADPVAAAEALYNDGMDLLDAGREDEGAALLRRALKLDPMHADAHNSLGVIRLRAGDLRRAEEYFRAAIDAGQRKLEFEGSKLSWYRLENRPYLRGLGNLALVFDRQQKWAEALAIHRKMLKLNPNDNQGVRWMVGLECLRIGNDQAAVKAFKKVAEEEVGCAFGLALARLRIGSPDAEIGEALLTGFAQNRYVAPMLLGERWRRLDAFHGSNTAEPEWAADVIEAQGDIWHDVPRGAAVLRAWWAAPPVASWRREIDAIMVRLKALPVSPERSALVETWHRLMSRDKVRDLRDKALSVLSDS